METKINKKFNCEVLIKTDETHNTKNPEKIGNKKAVHLEDPLFEEQFEVYSDEQIESRYLLTTAFMERLLNYKLKKKCNVEVFFSNFVSENGNVFLFIDTRKNHFEIPTSGKIINKDLFYNILQELREILEIIDALKLEQNIGM